MSAMKKKDIVSDSIISDEDISSYFKKQLGCEDKDKVESFISTGSTLLDFAISNRKNGGIPVGRVTEISGFEAVGKSLLGYHILSNTQKAGGVAVYIDTERSYNQEFMERMGVDTRKLIMPANIPQSIEEVFEFIEKVAKITLEKFPKKDKPVVIVWDSVAATPGKNELETNYSDEPRMGIAARAMSRSLMKFMNILDMNVVTLVCINQLREKIGVGYGDNSTTPHGKALPFYSSVRVKLGSCGQIKDVKLDRTVGVKTYAKVIKNKVGPAWRRVDFPLYYDFGVNDELSWMDFLKDIKIVESRGAWSYLKIGEDEHRFQGSVGWEELLKDENIANFVLQTLEEHLVYKLDKRPDNVEFNENSVMDIEQLGMDLTK